MLALALLFPGEAPARKSAGLAETPLMGWNSWNTFGCKVDARLIRQIADAMVASGMKEAGYEYINIDDCWHGGRDSMHATATAKRRFPSPHSWGRCPMSSAWSKPVLRSISTAGHR